ncbi:MAG: DUF4912 domain-containing protein [Candidatus Eremiobacterota bacterium]
MDKDDWKELQMPDTHRRSFARKVRSSEAVVNSEWQIVEYRLDECPGSSENVSVSPEKILEIKEEISEELLEAPELPEFYGEDRLVILPRDPFTSYCYWEITEQTKEETMRKSGFHLSDNPGLLLRLYRLSSDIHCFEKVINSEAYETCSMYIDYSAPYNLFYGKLGYSTVKGDFLPLVTSSIPDKLPLSISLIDRHEKAGEGWFEIELKEGKQQLREIAPPPIPVPFVSFDLLVTKQIKPDEAVQKETIPAVTKKENIYYEKIKTREDIHPGKIKTIERRKDIQESKIETVERRKGIGEIKEYKEKISWKPLALTGELSHVPENIPVLIEDKGLEGQDRFRLVQKIHREEIQWEFADFSPDIKMLFHEKLEKEVPHLYKLARKIDSHHTIWKILQLPPHIRDLFQERLIEEKHLPFSNSSC